MPERYAVIGHPVAHSFSPLIHAAFARETGRDMEYVRVLAPLDAFVATVEKFRREGGRGANVTLPFKEEAFRLARRHTQAASAGGAVNTLRFEAQDCLGDNTDGVGLVRDLRDNLGRAIAAARILLVGAGGAARGGGLPLLDEAPRELVIANRTAARAVALAQLFGRSVEASGFAALIGRQFDIVI